MKHLWTILLLVCAVVGCGGASPVEPTATLPVGITSEAVRLTTEDGVEIAGTLYHPGTPDPELAVVLAHMRPTDQTSWAPLAQSLAEQGISALTLDFRGYGQSGGKKDLSTLALDVAAALGYLRDTGFSRLVCIGASMGGTACAKAAHTPGISGLAVLSSPLEMDPPLSLSADDFADLTIPKLFVASQDDHPYVEDVQQMADWSPEPKQIEIYSGSAHGTYIFNSEHSEELSELLMEFVK